MNFTSDFLDQAQSCIAAVFRGNRETLVAANGNADHEFKDDATVVTDFDKKMELELKQTLGKLDAGIGFEGEEYGIEGNRDSFWLVDPIDGTESFIRGLPFFRNMATLIDNGRPILAVVYRVVSDELFVAKKGGGTSRNGQKLSVSQRPLHRVRAELSTHLDVKETWPVIAALEKEIEHFRSADEFLYVVEAKIDAHLVYKSDTKSWDNAPRMLLLEETGAKVANIGSETYDYRQGDWLAAEPEVFRQMMQCIDRVLTSEARV